MDIRFTPFNVTSAVLLALTVWVVIARFRGVIESNWPLFYYLGVAVYNYLFPGYLEPAWIYAGVIGALLLRFEFMAGGFLKLIRVVELMVLAYLSYALVATIEM